MTEKLHNTRPVVWTIAGSDSGGGAGIQADLHTFQDFNVHGCSVITAVTAQNSLAVENIFAIDKHSVSAQLQALDSDLAANAIKLGMLADKNIVDVVAKYLQNYSGFVVCDPVMTASSGRLLLDSNAKVQFIESVLPHVDLITPNVPEATVLTGVNIKTAQDVVAAAQKILTMGPRSVLLTGGHWDSQNGQCLDYWTDGEVGFWLSGENVNTINTHGSGCTLSAAIAAIVGKGYVLADAMVVAKAYVTQGIRAAINIGEGPGPVMHNGWPSQLCDFPMLIPHSPDRIEDVVSTQRVDSFKDCDGALGLYPVVDSIAWIKKLLPLGIPTIQLRIKDVSENVAKAQIKEAVSLCSSQGVRLFVNDYWELAIEFGAYGVHLGQEDLDSADLSAIAKAGLRLGVSTHCYYEIARAHGIQPSYVAIGPVYSTTTKEMKFSALGITQLKQWVDLLSATYPLTAIGGISVERAKDVLATGVESCAMVTAITLAQNYTDVVEELMSLVDSAGKL